MVAHLILERKTKRRIRNTRGPRKRVLGSLGSVVMAVMISRLSLSSMRLMEALMDQKRPTMISIAAQRTTMESNRASKATNQTIKMIRAAKDFPVFLWANTRPVFKRLLSSELCSSRPITIS